MENTRILVVDDEARMRKLVKDFLSAKGYDVAEAADGEDPSLTLARTSPAGILVVSHHTLELGRQP